MRQILKMKIKDNKVIGLCGVAQSGKDTFCATAIKLFEKQGLVAKRVSFADALKADVNDFLMEKVGISAFTTKLEEKTLIRDFLVAYGTKLMRRRDENCWINKARELVNSNTKEGITTIITDIRYENEIDWVQKELKGLCLHITRKSPEGSGVVPPANKEEEKNDPILKKKCDRALQWATIEEEEVLAWVVADELDQLFDLK